MYIKYIVIIIINFLPIISFPISKINFFFKQSLVYENKILLYIFFTYFCIIPHRLY